jgi:ribulose-phosphate 3-epimerase
MRVSLSLWSVDQAHLAEEVHRYDPLIESFHVDVMDGRFADNLLFGPLTVETLRALTGKRIIVHLMVAEPRRWVSRFIDAGADLLAVHPSACQDFRSTLLAIRDGGAAAGAAIGLEEPAQPVLDNLAALSVVLVVATSLGVKGQPFDAGALDTVRQLAGARNAHARPEVFVDGGIRWPSIQRIATAGADGVVAGSVVTSANDPPAVVRSIAALGA